jgi:hypothetical protein
MKEKFKKINIFYSYFYSKSSETREIINTIILLNLVYQNIDLEKFFKTSTTMKFDLSNILYVTMLKKIMALNIHKTLIFTNLNKY